MRARFPSCVLVRSALAVAVGACGARSELAPSNLDHRADAGTGGVGSIGGNASSGGGTKSGGSGGTDVDAGTGGSSGGTAGVAGTIGTAGGVGTTGGVGGVAGQGGNAGAGACDGGQRKRPLPKPLRTLSFAPATYQSVPTASYSLAAGDFNGDCILDLVLPVGDGTTACVLLGNGDGTFGSPIGGSHAYTVYPIDIAVGDFNRDGRLDVVTGAWTFDQGAQISVLLGNGDGTFQTAQTYLSASGGQVVVADLNGDGVLDIVVPGESTPGVWLGKGDGTFTVLAMASGVFSNAGGVVADLDGDGTPDLATARYSSGAPVNLPNGNGDGTFGSAKVLAKGFNSAWLAVGDFNEDGHLDLAYNNDGADVIGADGGTLTVLLGPTWASRFDIYAGRSPRALAVADFDLDGHLDLVNGQSPLNGVRVTLGNGDGTLRAGTTCAIEGYSRYDRIAVGDFNRDGKPDIAVATARLSGQSVGILLNTSR